MMRLPRFSYRAPQTLDEAVRILASEGPGAQVIAGGTDLIPNMKRRQQTPTTLVSLRHIERLKRMTNGDGLVLGATVTLTEIVNTPAVRECYTALHHAAAQVATVH